MKVLQIILATIAILSFSSCKEDDPVYMLWDVTGKAPDTMEILNAPGYHPQIVINTDYAEGEVTIKCTNFKEVFFDTAATGKEEYVNEECHFSAKKVDANTVKISIKDMPPAKEPVSDLFIIWAKDGKNKVTTPIAVNRGNKK